MKHYSIILGTLVASCVLFACTQKEEEIPVSSVTISQPTAEMIVGETVKLSATISPSNATDKDVIWASSKQSVATIDRSGLVTAIAEGTSNITATAGGKTGTCLITVSKKIIEVSSIELNKTELSLIEEEEFTLVATVKPEDATDKSVTWTSSDSSVAAVENGKVTAIKEGTTSITAKAGNKSVSCVVSVSKKVIAVTEVILDNTSLSMVEGDEITLTATVKPDDAIDKTVSWSSSNASIAGVSASGEVTALKEGTAVITAKSGDKSANCTVTVKKPFVAVESVSLDNISLELTEGEKATLTATVLPNNATDKSVNWSSSNASIAGVSASGEVTALKEGTAVITAKSGDKSANCTVTVKKLFIPVESISLNKTCLTLNLGTTETLVVTLTPSNATEAILWKSRDEDIALVDQSGKVDAIAVGETDIIAYVGSIEAICKVSVIIPVRSITLSQTSLKLSIGEGKYLSAYASPWNATNRDITWYSENPSIATIDGNGLVTGLQKGTTKVCAKSGDVVAACAVEVEDSNTEQIEDNGTDIDW